ncbi:GTP pyrophosphokinase [Ligilactobacillus equi]|uniref:GTP pyrophosphokinase n=1 Tax=Ligilactobacillus equi TaxID=137357 RepID=UPI001563E7C5|nr:GTP pyrophosphokinase family protein [Ligilactobacillus equi]MCQ2557136.1 GTP pyrophosphokinase family protein [Ligilactobacillus sp.]
MVATSIYGEYEAYLPQILEEMMNKIRVINQEYKENRNCKLYEHLIGRIKTENSMREKCQRKGLAMSTKNALWEIKDAIAIRVVCGFVDDIYTMVEQLRALSGWRVIQEKDYVKNAKPNGYRSYHMIFDIVTKFPDINGRQPGHYYLEVQLRTIAMDSWASLEHEMKYKHDIKDPEKITKELKRCADELASCDISMQTIRQLIHEED